MPDDDWFEDEDPQGNDIVYYLADEDGNEIGYAYRLEGKIFEYYYETADDAVEEGDDWNEEEPDPNGIYTLYEESEFY